MTALVTGDGKGFSQSHTASKADRAWLSGPMTLALVLCHWAVVNLVIPWLGYPCFLSPTSTMEKPCGLLTGTKTKSISSFSNYYILPYAGGLL